MITQYVRNDVSFAPSPASAQSIWHLEQSSLNENRLLNRERGILEYDQGAPGHSQVISPNIMANVQFV